MYVIKYKTLFSFLTIPYLTLSKESSRRASDTRIKRSAKTNEQIKRKVTGLPHSAYIQRSKYYALCFRVI